MSASLAGRHLVVSAGPTFEDIDPVRFIGNRSSGKMGFAIAAVAAARGARVTLVAGPVPFTARNYDSSSYVFDAADDRLVVVNANLALEEEPAPELAVADDATGEQLETEAASAYRSMAEAAQADGVELNLVTGWQDADARTAAYEARLTAYSAENSRLSAEEAADHTASLQPAASTSEQGTGYCADVRITTSSTTWLRR